jgi:hypothetical protein
MMMMGDYDSLLLPVLYQMNLLVVIVLLLVKLPLMMPSANTDDSGANDASDAKYHN